MKVKEVLTNDEYDIPNQLVAILRALRGEVRLMSDGYTGIIDTLQEQIDSLLNPSQSTSSEYWLKDVPEDLEQIVLQKLAEKKRITADDVFDVLTAKASDRDPRIVGSVFMSMRRKGLIKAVGSTVTKRPGTHAAKIAVWEKIG